jgi:hypothetical protein
MTTTHQDAATRAAEALKRAFCIERLVDDPEYPGEDEWVIADKEEIASILRPFMETKEDKDEKEAMQIIGRTLVHFRDLSRYLSDEVKRKDEEIKRLRVCLEGIRDAALDNMEGADADEFIYQEALFKACADALEGIDFQDHVKKVRYRDAMNPPDDGKTLERGEM